METPSQNTHNGRPENIKSNVTPQNLPNGNLVLILGILSILFCWWHLVSIAGLVLGIVALVLAKRETDLYNLDPARYTISSMNNVKTGRICAMIGLAISIIVFTFVILLVVGILVSLPFWGMIH
jgi:hypothetical protein